MLHIASGSAISDKLNVAHLSGSAISYDDVLHEGPVPAGETAKLREVRAGFISQCGWEPYDRALERFSTRDAAFDDACGLGEEIVLWFERDLACQLALIDLLQRLANRATPASVIPIEEHLGSLTAAQLSRLFPQRRPVSAAQMTAARQAWTAFTAPDPSGLRPIASKEISPLAHLPAALRRHLAEFPSVDNGLSTTQQAAVAALAAAAGPMTARELFVAATTSEDVPFMSDAVFFTVLRQLARGRLPAIAYAGPDHPVSLTPSGWALSDHQSDWAALNGFDIWRGGVHLLGMDASWRWDAKRRDLVGPETDQ